MKRLWNLLSQPEFHAMLFAIGLVVLNWPFLGTLRQRHPEVVLGTILMLWAFAIVLLFLVNRSCRGSLGEGDPKKGKNRNA